MVLVDPRVLDPPSVVPDATQESLKKIDRDMTKAVEDESATDSERAAQLQQLLFHFLRRYEQYKNARATPPPPMASQPLPSPPPPSTQSDSVVVKEVLDTVPKSFKRKAELLLDRVKRDPHLAWNDQGELIVRGQVINHSNIADLVNDALRTRRGHPTPPEGWRAFAAALRRVNTPKEWIGNPARRDFLGDEVKEEASDDLGETKKRKRKRKVVWEELPS